MIGAAILLAFALGVFFVVTRLMRSTTSYATVNNHSYSLLLADTEAQREQGLGGRTSLPLDKGMLFRFRSPGSRCFWMRGMHFPLDIIWMDSRHRIIAIAHGVSPATYPESFCPQEAAQYVLEINAGQAQRYGIDVGETAALTGPART